MESPDLREPSWKKKGKSSFSIRPQGFLESVWEMFDEENDEIQQKERKEERKESGWNMARHNRNKRLNNSHFHILM